MEFLEISKQEHDEFVTAHPLCNLLQSSKWGEVKTNWKPIFVGVKDTTKIIASAMILVKPLPLTFTMFYIPRGPVMDYENKEVVQFMMKRIKTLTKKHHCVMITFDPAIHCNDYTLANANEEHYGNMENILSNLSSCGAKFKGFSKELSATIQPRYHACVYACEDFENSVTKTMKKALQTVEKKKIKVEAHHDDGVEAFSKVMHLTEERKNIHLRDEAYFHNLMRIYGEDAVIYLAKLPVKQLLDETILRLEQNNKDLSECPENAKKKRFTLEELHASLTREVSELQENYQRVGEEVVVSGALCIRFGSTAELLYAGMDDRYKRYMAPYASFYKCMLWSFEKGCTWCNMGGIEGNLKGGLTSFKANYNPTINEFIGEFDLPVNTFIYTLAKMAMRLRSKRLHKK